VNFDNLKLRTKVLIPLSVMALVVVAMVAFGAFQLASVSGKASEVIERRDKAAAFMARATRRMLEAPYSVFGALVFDSDSVAGRAANEGFTKAAARGDEMLVEVMKLVPENAAEVGKFKDRFHAIMEKAQKPFQIGLDTPGMAGGGKTKPEDLDQMAAGALLLAEVDTEMRGLMQDMVKFNDAWLSANAQAAVDLRAQSSDALFNMAAVGLVSTMLAGAFSLWVASCKIAGPLGRLGQRMGSLANGELTVAIEGQDRRDEVGDMAKAVQVFKDSAIARARLETDAVANRAAADAERERTRDSAQRGADEQAEALRRLGDGLKNLAAGDLRTQLGEGFSAAYAQIRDDFNQAIDKLKQTMLSVVSSTDSIQAGTQEISTASDDLSRRTEQQAASLEETAAALDEITATVKKSAEGANHAREVVAAADGDAKKSALVVRQAVEAMDAIATSSRQITQIIGVIDEIAFQTNLLALNAGVEAARAGDAGRGFAVVASEVRALAQRSADAAKEIKGLISTSTTQVEHGVKLVAETGQSLERIMAQVTEINGIVIGIAAGAKEQATALDEVNSAINQMDQVTQQNSAMVEQSTAASHSLSQETSQLSALIGQFQVGAGRDMRRELQKAAPHAFRQPAKVPPASRGRA
jgi:methyl-accepting chemotaxis protein